MRHGLLLITLIVLTGVVVAQSPDERCHRKVKFIDEDTRLITLKDVAPCGWWVIFPPDATWGIHPNVPITVKTAANQKPCKLNQYGILKTTRSGCVMVFRADRKRVAVGVKWKIVLGQVWIQR